MKLTQIYTLLILLGTILTFSTGVKAQSNNEALAINLFDVTEKTSVYSTSFSSGIGGDAKTTYPARGSYGNVERDACTQWNAGDKKDCYCLESPITVEEDGKSALRLTSSRMDATDAASVSLVCPTQTYQAQTWQTHGFNNAGSFIGGEKTFKYGVVKFSAKLACGFEGTWQSAFLTVNNSSGSTWGLELNPLEVIQNTANRTDATDEINHQNGNWGFGYYDVPDGETDIGEPFCNGWHTFGVAVAPWGQGEMLVQYMIGYNTSGSERITRQFIIPDNNHGELHLVLKNGVGNSSGWAGVASETTDTSVENHMYIDWVNIDEFKEGFNAQDALTHYPD